MKSLKTYNMDYDVIQILRSKPNKSKFVCESVRLRAIGEEQFDVHDVSTRQLIIALKDKDDISAQLVALLELELRS